MCENQNWSDEIAPVPVVVEFVALEHDYPPLTVFQSLFCMVDWG